MADQEDAADLNGKVDRPEKPHHHRKTPCRPTPASAGCDYYYRRPKGPRKALWTILITIFFLLAGVTLLILWLVYRPHKPQFTVVGAAIYELNTTNPPFLSSSIQFTLQTRNPNKRLAILYDRLTAYVSYRDQKITPAVALPPLHQGRKATVTFSPVMCGEGVAVPMEVANGLEMDQGYGVVALRVVIMGRLRWKAGGIRTGRYGVYVRCDLLVGFRRGFLGQVPLLASPHCNVDV